MSDVIRVADLFAGVGGFRLPLYEMEEKNREILRAEMKKMGLI